MGTHGNTPARAAPGDTSPMTAASQASSPQPGERGVSAVYAPACGIGYGGPGPTNTGPWEKAALTVPPGAIGGLHRLPPPLRGRGGIQRSSAYSGDNEQHAGLGTGRPPCRDNQRAPGGRASESQGWGRGEGQARLQGSRPSGCRQPSVMGPSSRGGLLRTSKCPPCQLTCSQPPAWEAGVCLNLARGEGARGATAE